MAKNKTRTHIAVARVTCGYSITKDGLKVKRQDGQL